MMNLISKNMTYIVFVYLIVVLLIRHFKNDTMSNYIKEISYYARVIAVNMVFVSVGYICIYKTFPSDKFLYYFILGWAITAMIGCLPLMVNIDNK